MLGDIPAHALADVGRQMLAGLKQFLAMRPGGVSNPLNSENFSASPAVTPAMNPVPPDAEKAA